MSSTETEESGKRKDESVKDTDGKGVEGGRESEKRGKREKK